MRKNWAALALTGMLCLTTFAGTQTVSAETADSAKQVDIVFTHDTHSHLNTFTTIVDEAEKEVGGFARINTLIQEQKAKNPDTMVIDGGDFSMGTLIQTVFETQAAEIRMLGYMGCDVTTLGNHEFDYRSKGLANMLNSAAESGDDLPAMVVCNVDWESMEAAGLSEGQQLIRDAFDEYGVSDYVVLEKGDTDIAVVGVFGKDALACAPTCELLFKDPIKAVKETVEEIRENEDVDMIVCVSHSGTWEDESKSEDENLAKAVPDLDLILSGHTHTTLEEPIVHGDTYVYAVENAADFDGVPVDVAVVPSGTVRDTYAKGDITVEQVFNSFSLGIGADGVPGYPLISVYLTGKELKTAAEIDASVSDFMTTARLYCSGLDFTYNPNRMILNKVTDVYLDDGTQRIELEDDKLYRVVADLYSGQMLSAVTDMSYGLLSLVPKYADGTPIEDFEDVIITENGKELKAWDAIARYMESFEDTDGDGIANVPEYYSTTHYRKQVDDSRNIVDLVKNPNKFTAIIVGAIAVLILLVIFIIVLIKKIVKKVKSRKMKK